MRQNREGTLSLQRYTCGTSHRLSELRKQPLGEVPSEETEDVHAGRIRESSVLGILRTHYKLLWVAYMVVAAGPGLLVVALPSLPHCYGYAGNEFDECRTAGAVVHDL